MLLPSIWPVVVALNVGRVGNTTMRSWEFIAQTGRRAYENHLVCLINTGRQKLGPHALMDSGNAD